mmetsp:Transcript_13375/g.30794  ORF Transcript_13375/g.30794 Transcript_13375/m.30794 type:complete len:119 (+) Transcript_13375:43-399(+)
MNALDKYDLQNQACSSNASQRTDRLHSSLPHTHFYCVYFHFVFSFWRRCIIFSVRNVSLWIISLLVAADNCTENEVDMSHVNDYGWDNVDQDKDHNKCGIKLQLLLKVFACQNRKDIA